MSSLRRDDRPGPDSADAAAFASTSHLHKQVMAHLEQRPDSFWRTPATAHPPFLLQKAGPCGRGLSFSPDTSAIAQLLAQEVIKLRREVAQLRAGGAGGAGDKDTQAQIQRLEVPFFIRPTWSM